MKKILLSFVIVAFASLSHAQTATNFTCNDCSGNSHDLFTELDAGKVIVICWVMPCGACIGPASTAYTVVQGYQSANPNKVFLYLVDDVANTTCGNLDSWGTGNGAPSSAFSLRFSNSSIDMLDYGTAGMPKTVVIGGPNHTVFYNVNNTQNSSVLQGAINSALSATGIIEPNPSGVLSVFPNPSAGKTEIKFTLANAAQVTLQLFNLQGELVRDIYNGKLNAGENKFAVNTSQLSAGMYLLKMSKDGKNSFVNLVVGE